MNHYEVLGVNRSASKAEIRRAYLDLARRHHPDLNLGAAAPVRSAESDPSTGIHVGIREINAAWDVLGDAARRADYDRLLATTAGGGAPPGQWSNGAGRSSAGFRSSPDGSTTASRINRPRSGFTPHDPDADTSDTWRYTGDTINDATVPPKLLLAAPPLLFVVGTAFVLLWLVIGIDALMAIGAMLLFFSLLLFVGAPLVAMARSQNEEIRARRRR